MEKMIKNLKNLLEVLNLNNVLNVNIGLKEFKAVVLCQVDVDINFVMIVVEVIVRMVCVRIRHRKGDISGFFWGSERRKKEMICMPIYLLNCRIMLKMYYRTLKLTEFILIQNSQK